MESMLESRRPTRAWKEFGGLHQLPRSQDMRARALWRVVEVAVRNCILRDNCPHASTKILESPCNSV